MTEQTTDEHETVGAPDDSADEASTAGDEHANVDEGADGPGEEAFDDESPVPHSEDGTESSGATDATADGDPSAEEGAVPDATEVSGDQGDLQDEYDSLNDRHLRLVAEFNNFRRRSEQERMAAWGRAQADLVSKLLDVLDDLQRVADLDLSNATVEAIMEGIDLVERKFVRQLQEAGVEVVDPTGEAFDPERMEAMMRVPAESDDQVDTVAQVFQKGYSLKGTLVRPARVSVYTQG